MDLSENGLGCVDWIRLAQDRDRWRAVVNAVMNLRVLAPQLRATLSRNRFENRCRSLHMSHNTGSNMSIMNPLAEKLVSESVQLQAQ
jgi:hypothetical protein